MVNVQRRQNNVAYSTSCTEHDVYVGETEHPIRERFQEHYGDAKTLAVRSP